MNNNQELTQNIEINPNNLNQKQPKPKKKTKTIILTIILIILIGLLISTIILYKYASSLNPFAVVIDNTFNYLENSFVENQTINTNLDLKINGTSQDEDINQIFSILNKVDLSLNYGLDYENSIANLDLKTKYNNQKLLNANIYMENGYGYIYLEELYDKYIKTEIEGYDEIFNNDNIKEYKVIIKSIHKAVNNSLKEEYFEEAKTTLDGKEVNKVSITIDNTKANSIKNDFLNTLLNDDEFLESMSKINETSVSELKEELQDSLEEKIEDEDYETITLAIYTKGGKFVKFEMKDQTNLFEVIEKDGKYEYKYQNNELSFHGTIAIKNDNDKISTTITFTDNNTLNLEINMTSTTKYDIKISKQDITNSINPEQITNEDYNTIYANLEKQDGLLDLIEDINEIYNANTNEDTDIEYQNNGLTLEGNAAV